MGARVTEEALIRAFADEGIAVVETRKGMIGDRVGWYSLEKGIVAIHPDLMQHQRVPVLLHEWFHHVRGDDGHQDEATERRIDEMVAQELIDPVDYAWCESQFGWSTGGIAAELGTCTWVVRAYRRYLKRSVVAR